MEHLTKIARPQRLLQSLLLSDNSHRNHLALSRSHGHLVIVMESGKEEGVPFQVKPLLFIMNRFKGNLKMEYGRFTGFRNGLKFT